MAWVVELTGVDNADGVEKTKLFSMGGGLAPSDHPHIPGGLVSWKSPNQKIQVSKEGSVVVAADEGAVSISNTPPDTQSPGPNDALARWAWHGRAASLYWVESTWAGRLRVAFGSLRQPVSSLAASDSPGSTLAFSLRDPRSALTGPLQSVKYAGTNTAGAGVEGEADLKGKPKPIVYGLVSNWAGVNVNRQKQIWQLADKAATVLCVRDGGGALGVGVARANLASLQSSDPAPGKYDYYAGAEGTFIRVATSPNKILTTDVQEGANAAARTHAQIWKRIRTERCGTDAGDINAASVTATDALEANVVGFRWSDDTTQLEALNELLGSLSGYEVLGFDEEWRIGQLRSASGTSAINLVSIQPDAELVDLDRPYTKAVKVRPDFAPDGAPPCRVNVKWGRNNRVMSETDFIGWVPIEAPRLVEKFGEEWRTETAASTSIWDPVALTGLYPNAPELTVKTGFQPGVDNLTCPHAADEAQRLLNLYSRLPGQYQVTFRPKITDQILPGDAVTFSHPQFMLAAGPKMRVLQAGWIVTDAGAEVDLVIGFAGGIPQLDFSKAENSQYIIFLTL